MKKIASLFVVVILISCWLPASAQSNSWNILFNKTVPACTSPMGMTAGDTCLYTGSASKAVLFRLSFDSSKIIDSVTVKGLPKSSLGTYFLGFAWDGISLYVANGDAAIYHLNAAMNAVADTIKLPTGTTAGALAYDPTADNGKGGFWTVLQKSDIKLFSRKGELLNTITAEDLNYVGDYWGLAIDTLTGDGVRLYALERYPQNIFRIHIPTKKIDAPLHNITSDFPTWATKYVYGLYISDKVVAGKTTLAAFYMSRYHVGYDFATVNHLDSAGVRLVGSDMIPYHRINTPLNVTARFVCTAAEALTSGTFNYSVNGGEPVTAAFTGNYRDYVGGFALTHGEPFTPTTTGDYTLKLWLSDVNGYEGLNSDTLTHTFTVYERGVQRMVLHEGFTSATCNPCKAGNAILQELLETHKNVTCIKYQMNFPGAGDPYYTSEGETRRTYYNVMSVPSLRVDGNIFNGNTGQFTAAALEHEIARPALVELGSTFRYNGDKKFNVSITARPLEAITGNIRLFAALVEKETRKNIADEYLRQYGEPTFSYNFDTLFHYVMKKFLTPVTGTVISLNNTEQTVSQNFEYQFVGNYRLPNDASSPIDYTKEHSVENFNNVAVVYWVQNYATKEVLQAGYNEGGATGICEEPSLSELNFRIYPNPANNVLNISTDCTVREMAVYNMFGQQVMTANGITVSVGSLPAGVYILKADTDEGMITRKFIKR